MMLASSKGVCSLMSLVAIAGSRILSGQEVSSPRVIDLSLLVAPEYPCTWPGGFPFYQFTPHLRIGPASAYNVDILTIDGNTGTQLDAPPHSIPRPGSKLPNAGPFGEMWADTVPAWQLCGEACVIDVRELLDTAPNGRSPLIEKKHVMDWEKKHRSLGPGDVVLFRSDYSDKYYKPLPEGRRFVADPVEGKAPAFPNPSPECMDYVGSRGVLAAGTDSPSMGPIPDLAEPTHVAGLKHGMIWTEGATGLGVLPATGTFYCMLAPKHSAAPYAECRAFAIAGDALARRLIDSARKKRAWSNGVPIYSFGNVVYVYGVSPDLLPGVVLQEGNNHPVVKVKPKKSWELGENFCGDTQPEPAMRTPWNDDQPYLPIHLIDGDPDTVWGAYGMAVPDERPEWILITLPVESVVASVSLICPKDLPRGGRLLIAGKLLPKELAIKTTRDSRSWETVYENKDFTGDDSGPNLIQLEKPARCKQIMIVGSNLRETKSSGYVPYSFSIGEVEVKDPAGRNLALISNGAGVTVSSTTSMFSENRVMTDLILPPTVFDLGYKWMRQGLDNGVYLWQYVEREKGKLKLDERAERWIRELNRGGVNYIMCLDTKGNFLYSTPPDKVDWRKLRTRVSFGLYEDGPPFVGSDPNQLEGWLRFVDYMVRRLSGRIAYWEIGNEFDPLNMDDFIRVYKAGYHAIKNVNAEAKVMVGSLAAGRADSILTRWGPGSGVRDGKLAAKGRLIAVAEGVKLKDASVKVDADSQHAVGIVLRFKDKNNSLIASYNPDRKAIEFFELVDDTQATYSCFSVDPVTVVPAEGLGSRVHLSASVQGSKATLTVSDGKSKVTGTHDIKAQSLQAEGGIGLCKIPFAALSDGDPASGLHLGPNARHPASSWAGTIGTFDDFEVADGAGKVVKSEDFSQIESDGVDGRAQPLGWRAHIGHWDLEGILHMTDAIGWHMSGFSVRPEACTSAIKEFRKDLEALGFRGKLMATELYHNSWFPPPVYKGYPDGQVTTDMQMAKNLARDMIGHLGTGVWPFYCNTYRMSLPSPQTVFRNTKPQDAVGFAEAKPAYYMLRSLCNAMEGCNAVEVPVALSDPGKFVHYTFTRGRREALIAVWTKGTAPTDGVSGAVCDITFQGIQATKAWALDLINGTAQELDCAVIGKDTMIRKVMVQDYPVLVRVPTKP